LILGGGLIPQPGVRSRYHAAVELIRSRVASGETPADVLTARRGIPEIQHPPHEIQHKFYSSLRNDR
jgi:hypothetical protein